MNQYIAAKPCNFAGRRYSIGEAIEPGAVDPNRAPTLEKYGVIRKATTQDAPTATAAKKPTGRKKVE